MARRALKAGLDAKMENPEERKFQPGFLDDILAARASHLSDALAIWRWARQNQSTLTARADRSAVMRFWCQWVRDPLLNLGLRDPVDRIAEIKANDPKRLKLVATFETWWATHGDNLIKAT